MVPFWKENVSLVHFYTIWFVQEQKKQQQHNNVSSIYKPSKSIIVFQDLSGIFILKMRRAHQVSLKIICPCSTVGPPCILMAQFSFYGRFWATCSAQWIWDFSLMMFSIVKCPLCPSNISHQMWILQMRCFVVTKDIVTQLQFCSLLSLR